MELSAREKTLKALRDTANDPNVNENVAMEAIKKLHEYSERWGLNIEDIEDKSDATSEAHYRQSEGQFSVYGQGIDMVDRFCTMAIARFYACRAWKITSDHGNTMCVFYGHEVDVEAATTLRWIIRAAMKVEWNGMKYRLSVENPKCNLTNEKLSFHMGMGDKLVERMEFIHRPDSYAPEGGTSLIVMKAALMEQHFAKLNLNLGRSHARSFKVSMGAYDAGQAAGSRVQFGTQVGGKTLRIGK